MTTTNRRTFLGLAGTAVAGAVAGGAMVAATDLLDGSPASASEENDAAISGGAALEIRGPSAPQVSELTPFLDPLRIPPTLRLRNSDLTEIKLVNAQIRLHSQMPATPMWTYAGYFPGPTIEVHTGERVRIAWENHLTGTTPIIGAIAQPVGPPPGVEAYNTPGTQGTTPRTDLAAVTPWTTVHVHGGHQHGIADGQPDGAVTPGSAQLSEYLNVQGARQLFYHDHAMPITAMNVMSGLIGNYLVRDETELGLDLPRGRFEIPLVLADANFDTDAKGLLTGQLLSKRLQLGPVLKRGVLPVMANFFGPYTLVNGVVWPYLDVEATAYRFRMLNISIGRSFSLVVVDEATGEPVLDAITVIGTDLGLLDEPRALDGPLPISPAERVDFVIDFAKYVGRRLRLVNTVPGVPPGTAVPAAIVPFPQVMQFRVGTRRSSSALPKKLDPDFKQITPADVPADATERFVLLLLNAKGMPTLAELQEVPADTLSGFGIIEIALPSGVRTFRIAASRFEDTTTFFAQSGGWEVWTIVSAAPPGVPILHPIHIHLLDFQILERHAIDGSGFDSGHNQTTKPLVVGDPIPIGVAESGAKDTVAVPPNTIVRIAGQLSPLSGRFMYHCHILDHEDEGMMRPLIVMPRAVLNVENVMMAQMDSTAATLPGAGPEGMASGMSR